jgi:hypothetical protein
MISSPELLHAKSQDFLKHFTRDPEEVGFFLLFMAILNP